jgi:hypothetical protein
MLVRFVADAFRRAMAHYGFWFWETAYQLGLDEALRIENEAGDKSWALQVDRLARTTGFEMKDGLPAVLWSMDEKTLTALLDSLAANWLANDGLWFQAVESRVGQFDAKRINDTCWSRFSPLEASRIRTLLDLPEPGGLDGLKQALGYRLYARLNRQEIVDETENSFVFRMVDCRVQSARKRKGLAEYPCGSVGIVEYRTFAATIDPRVKTTCVGCPPDSHPADWYCAWKFEMIETGKKG